MKSGEEQYLEHLKRIYETGYDIKNKRTGQVCRTIINADMEYNVGAGEFPLVTTRKSFYKAAIAELIGYLRGYNSAKQFRDIGCNTWNENANNNQAWLSNPHRKGEDDMGMVYGAVGRNWPKHDGTTIDLLYKVYNNLKNGIDDRGESLSFWNPGLFETGCLRPCMHTHTFSLVGDTLHLTSYQRSSDWCLGTVFNMVQVYTLLALMAQVTGHKPGIAYHKNINSHIYGNQLDLVPEQLNRVPFTPPKLIINPDIKTLEDILTWVSTDDFTVEGYECHPPIKYPFSV